MEKIIELATELKKEIDSLPLFQEYKRIKQLVDSSCELDELKKEIAKTTNDKEKHQELLNKYNSHPLVSNLDLLEKEVAEYLKEVCDIINSNN